MKKVFGWLMLFAAALPGVVLVLLPAIALAEAATVRPVVDLTPLLQAVIAIAATMVTGWLLPWIKAKTTEKQRENVAALTRTVVFAAEQMFGAGHGDEKLRFALEQMQRAGYKVDADLLRASIEEAVKEMNHGKDFWAGFVQDGGKEEASGKQGE